MIAKTQRLYALLVAQTPKLKLLLAENYQAAFHVRLSKT